ncbi:MAG: hypothetical protein AAF265_13945 [Pseudomonadota bacterium]
MTNDNDLNSDDQAFAERLVRKLEQPLDDATLARLQAAREEAVLAASAPVGLDRRWYVGGSLGGAVAAGVALFFILQSPTIQPLPDLNDAELAIVADIEVLESLELLAWLDDEMLAEESLDEG